MKPETFRKVRAASILITDLLALLGVFSLLFALRVNTLPNFFAVELWLIIPTFIVVLFVSGTYFRGRATLLPKLPIHTFFVCCIGGVLCILWVYLLGPDQFKDYFGRGILPIATIIFGIIATFTRLFINRLYHRHEQGIELLYLGYSSFGNTFLKELNNHAEVRSVTVFTNQSVTSDFTRVSIINPSQTPQPLNSNWRVVIIDPTHQLNKQEASQLVKLRLYGTPVLSLAEYYERYWFMVPIDHIGDDWFLQSDGFSMLANPISNRIKRLFDIALSILLLLVTSPLLLLSGLLIKLTSKGPVFFTQTRVGLSGKLFTIYKLRTMYQNAEAGGAAWASQDDPRITLVGRFLRQSRLDELPQCWNVLIGDMSFVGPRPERPEFTEKLSEKIPYYELRHIVKPGISGWAQVIFPYGASVEDSMKKLQYELYYIKKQSLLLDFNIIIRTLFTVFQRAGR